MRTLAPLLPLAFLTLPGCIGLQRPPRTYTYDINLRNTSGRPVSVEFLRIDASRITKTRCDLAVGGYYANRFTTFNSAEYLEARLRNLDEPETAPRHIAELPKGHSELDIIAKDNRLTLDPRKAPYPNPLD